MASLTRAQMKQVVEQWKRAGPELERIRRSELELSEYDWRAVDDLLDLADRFRQPRLTSGMVEMQKWFMKLAEQQGLTSRAEGKSRVGRSAESGERA